MAPIQCRDKWRTALWALLAGLFIRGSSGCHPASRKLHICLNIYLERDFPLIEAIIEGQTRVGRGRGHVILEGPDLTNICSHISSLRNCYAPLVQECRAIWQLDRFARVRGVLKATHDYLCADGTNNMRGERSTADITQTVIKIKASILGVITAIKKWKRKTIYTVDDGTGSLDCVLWENESSSLMRINKLKTDLEMQNVPLSSEASETCHLLLRKVEMQEDQKPEYSHGDKMGCLGIVKLMNGQLLLNINQHYKVQNVNAETLWILDVLSVSKSSC